MAEAEPPPSDPERDKQIAELEARLARRPPVGVMPPVAALALAGAVALLWMQADDLAYFFSEKTPITLGVEADYHFDRALPNRYAEVRGVPTLKGAWGREGDQAVVVVGLQNTPLLVKRDALPGETWKPGTTPPQPDQRSFAVRGRLTARDAPGKWADAFVQHDGYGEVKAKWMLIEGERPGSDVRTMVWFGVLFAFAGVNLWLLLRGLLAFSQRRA